VGLTVKRLIRDLTVCTIVAFTALTLFVTFHDNINKYNIRKGWEPFTTTVVEADMYGGTPKSGKIGRRGGKTSIKTWFKTVEGYSGTHPGQLHVGDHVTMYKKEGMVGSWLYVRESDIKGLFAAFGASLGVVSAVMYCCCDVSGR
jgi:hypothetical protein